MYSLKVLTCHRTHLHNLIFRTITICRVFAIRKLQSSGIVPPQQWGQSATLTAALKPERRGLTMTILLTRRHCWQEEMCHHVTFQLGSTDSDVPVLCRVYKVPLTSLIQLLKLSKKKLMADFSFSVTQLVIEASFVLLLFLVSPLDITISLINLCCNY